MGADRDSTKLTKYRSEVEPVESKESTGTPGKNARLYRMLRILSSAGASLLTTKDADAERK